MDFEFGEEQIYAGAHCPRVALDKEYPKKHVRTMMDDEKGYSPELWKKMAGLGWQGLAFPEQYGGMGSTFLDLCVLLEEMGRALVQGPVACPPFSMRAAPFWRQKISGRKGLPAPK